MMDLFSNYSNLFLVQQAQMKAQLLRYINMKYATLSVAVIFGIVMAIVALSYLLRKKNQEIYQKLESLSLDQT